MNARFTVICVLAVILSLATASAAGCGGNRRTELVLATTTSTMDSGLLDVLIPKFEEEYGYTVKTLAVGSGEAIRMGERGDADVLLVHSRDDEIAFVKGGYGLERVPVMWNDFIILVPGADPARVKGASGAVDAFRKIAAARATFVSRGDDSGTNRKELQLWAEAGVDPDGRPWYVETGQGMGETLTVADQKQGYTLSDRATHVTMRGRLALETLVEGDRKLINRYSVIEVNPDRHPDLGINVRAAGDFVRFMTSEDTRRLIRSYRKGGVVLFNPDGEGAAGGTGIKEE